MKHDRNKIAYTYNWTKQVCEYFSSLIKRLLAYGDLKTILTMFTTKTTKLSIFFYARIEAAICARKARETIATNLERTCSKYNFFQE